LKKLIKKLSVTGEPTYVPNYICIYVLIYKNNPDSVKAQNFRVEKKPQIFINPGSSTISNDFYEQRMIFFYLILFFLLYLFYIIYFYKYFYNNNNEEQQKYEFFFTYTRQFKLNEPRKKVKSVFIESSVFNVTLQPLQCNTRPINELCASLMRDPWCGPVWNSWTTNRYLALSK
jgi:hypothetical protein